MNMISTVLAQVDTSVDISTTKDFGGLTGYSIGGLIAFALNAIMIIAAVLFIFMLILGGVRWITSGGDKTGTESARNQVTAALIGLVIVFSAWIITNFVFGIFGITLGALDFGGIS